MKILITGASGFIGQSVLDKIVNESKVEKVYACFFSKKPNTLNEEKTNLIKIDLNNKNDVDEALEKIKPDILICCTWFVDHLTYKTSLKNFDWIENTYNLAQKFIENGGKKFVYMGTCFEEIKEFECVYSKCKKLTSFMLNNLFKNPNTTLNIIRPSFVYGLGEPLTKLISANIIKMLKNQPTQCLIPNSNLNFIHVDDLSNAIVKISLSELLGDFYIGNKSNTNIKDLMLYIAKKTNYDSSKIDFVNNEPYDLNFKSDLLKINLNETDIFKNIDSMIQKYKHEGS
jgi:nucleoside-diphosphate-sugar epimerase